MSEKCDVLIVGCGVSGLYTALSLPQNLNITVLSKSSDKVSNSSLAQGGVAAVLSLENDSYELHIEDTMIAGKRCNDIDAVTTLVHEGPEQVLKIMEYGVDFDKNPDGTLMKTLEGGHCRRRIVHHKDTTGAEMVNKLLAEVKRRKNITLLENSPVFKLCKAENGIKASVISNGNIREIYGSFCVLATGGIGRVYKYTTNPVVATGDGIRLAYELGAEIKNLSYVQFHPTAFNSSDNEQFLVSEAVRGEGAYLLNCNKERFMSRYDERLELAPRDVVSNAIIKEARRTGSDNFYLDIRYKGRDFILNRFPGIYEGCLKYGVDMTKDLIPVYPCQHYLMGGIRVNLNSQTTVDRLYAVGECSNTGVHGKNRLASNSLLEALVFAKRCADTIESEIKNGAKGVGIEEASTENRYNEGRDNLINVNDEIRQIMQECYFVIPAGKNEITKGLERVEEILSQLKQGSYKVTTDYCESLSLATVASIILKEAVLRDDIK